jgi:molybdenum cofactor cytidylyltransferase
MALTGILLAAGQGRRFGGGKLLHPLDSGLPIGIGSYRNLRAVLQDVLVVVRTGDHELRDLFMADGARVVPCDDAEQGLSRSLVCGVSSAPTESNLLVALADMPFVRADTLTQLVHALQSGALIAAPFHSGQRGNPVAFSRSLRDELLGASGDMGAREVLQRHASEIRQVICDDPGVLRDIDTREDLSTASAGKT